MEFDCIDHEKKYIFVPFCNNLDSSIYVPGCAHFRRKEFALHINGIAKGKNKAINMFKLFT